MAAEDILARFLQQQALPQVPVQTVSEVPAVTTVLPERGLPTQPVQVVTPESVVSQQPDNISLGLPQPISEIPLGRGAVIEEPSSAENTLQRFLQQQTAAQQVVEQPSDELGFLGGLKDLFTGESRTTPETEAAPEFGLAIGAPGSLEEFGFKLQLLVTATDDEKKNLIRKNLPGVKIRDDDKGNTFITLPDGRETILNKPGFSFQDAADLAADVVTFWPAVRLARFLKPLFLRALAGGTGAAVTEAGRQTVVQQLGGREEISLPDIGLAGVVGGGGEVIAPAVRAVGRGIQKTVTGVRRVGGVTPVIRDIPRITPQEDVLLGIPKEELPAAQAAVRRAREVSERTGLTIAPAQQLGDPQALRKQRLLAELSPSAKEATDFLRTSNREVFDEVERVLDVIAPPTSVETAAGRIKTAAEAAIEAKVTIRRELAAPVYDEAKKDLSPVALPETRTLINTIKSDLPPKEQTLIIRIENLLFPPGVIEKKFDPLTAPGRTVAKGFPTTKLHRAKIIIDDLINKRGEGALGNSQKKELIDIQTEFLRELDIANPKYKEARAVFAANSPAVDELKASIIGKITKLDDIQIERVGETLFKPGNNVSTIIKAKQVIESVDPQAWRDITRSVFETRLGNLKITKETAATQNVPAQMLRTIFGNNKQQKILFAGVDVETAKNLRWLKEGLELVKEGRPGGSETAGRLELIKELTRTGAPKRSILRAVAERPVKSLGSIVADVFSGFQTREGTTAEAIGLMGKLYFDPKWQPRLTKIRKLKPGSPAAAKSFLKLLEDVSKASLQTFRPQIEPVEQIQP